MNRRKISFIFFIFDENFYKLKAMKKGGMAFIGLKILIKNFSSFYSPSYSLREIENIKNIKKFLWTKG